MQTTVTKGQANHAGKVLCGGTASPDKLKEAETVLAAWRSRHAAPLAAVYGLLKSLSGADKARPAALAACRLKRMPSIIDKLKRSPAMQAGRMQDIGGVRIIVDTIQEVYALHHALAEDKDIGPLLVLPPKDYIARPKPDGYRSLHQILRCVNDDPPESGSLRIEVQIRTRLQHAWATAVETLGELEGASFKTGEGTETAKRFFQTASALFALDEGQPLPPSCAGLPPKDLVREFEELDIRLGASAKLKAAGLKQLPQTDGFQKSSMHLLVLDVSRKGAPQLSVQGYDDLAAANAAYSRLESQTRDDPSVYVLLMAADIARLQQAYPNYCLDASIFLENSSVVCSKHS